VERVFVPGTAVQVLVALLLLLPGFVFTATRSRLRGPVPGDGDIGQRILTSIGLGAVLDAVYVIVGGRHLTRLFDAGAPAGTWAAHPRRVTLLALGLLVLVPAVLAWLDNQRALGRLDMPLGRGRRLWLRYRGRYDPTPTAWDYAGPLRGSTFIRVRQPDGSWVGGWFGAESFLSTWPEPHDLFIESQWRMTADGQFVERLEGTVGVYVSCPQGVVVEWVDAPTDPPAPPAAPDRKRRRWWPR
jgi:Family of unknown function (DUF6338)